jgi:hypothetical protein
MIKLAGNKSANNFSSRQWQIGQHGLETLMASEALCVIKYQRVEKSRKQTPCTTKSTPILPSIASTWHADLLKTLDLSHVQQMRQQSKALQCSTPGKLYSCILFSQFVIKVVAAFAGGSVSVIITITKLLANCLAAAAAC